MDTGGTNNGNGNGNRMVGSNATNGNGAGGTVLRAVVLLSQAARYWFAPAVLVYAIVWREFQVQPIHIYFIAACFIAPVLIEQGLLRSSELTTLIRAIRGLPDATCRYKDGG